MKFLVNTYLKLVSQLQKSFRRGSTSSKVLYESINELSTAKPYNLPEQHYVKVSGTRQLFWRSFISIIEDVCGYDSDHFDLMTLCILSIICQILLTITFQIVLSIICQIN